MGQHDHDEDLRLSIAGAQGKTALLRHGGQWLLPHGSTPTTHIFKLPLGLVGHMQADMRQIIFWVLAATDGHGKNFSIALKPGGRYRSTPIYDVLSAHPVIGTGGNRIAPQKAKLAMAVRGSSNHYPIERIQRRHWIAQAQQVGLGAEAAERLIREVTETSETVIAEAANLLPSDFPMDLAEAIFNGMRRQSAKLAAAH